MPPKLHVRAGLGTFVGKTEALLAQRQSPGAQALLQQHGQAMVDASTRLGDVVKRGMQTGLTDGYCRFSPWNADDCLREFIQNMLDGCRQVAKTGLQYKTPVLFSEIEGNVTYLMAKDKDTEDPAEALAAVEVISSDYLILHQAATVLSYTCCQLTSDKGSQDNIGGFGEGLKMATLLLIRDHGGQVVYAQSGEAWHFRLKTDDQSPQKLQKLMVSLVELKDPAPAYAGSCLTIAIKGDAIASHWRPDRFLPFALPAAQQPPFGKDAVLPPSDAVPAGRVYVKGLFVLELDWLRSLRISVNLGSASLNRDRKIPHSRVESMVAKLLGDWTWAAASDPAAAASFELVAGMKAFVEAYAERLHGKDRCLLVCSEDVDVHRDVVIAELRRMGVALVDVAFQYNTHAKARALFQRRMRNAAAYKPAGGDEEALAAMVAEAVKLLPGLPSVEWRAHDSAVAAVRGGAVYAGAALLRMGADKAVVVIAMAGARDAGWEFQDCMKAIDWRPPIAPPAAAADPPCTPAAAAPPPAAAAAGRRAAAAAAPPAAAAAAAAAADSPAASLGGTVDTDTSGGRISDVSGGVTDVSDSGDSAEVDRQAAPAKRRHTMVTEDGKWEVITKLRRIA